MYTIISSARCNTFTFSSTTLKRYGEYGELFFVHDFSRIAMIFSPFNVILVIGLLYTVFIVLVCPL